MIKYVRRKDFINRKYSFYNLLSIAFLYLIIFSWPLITNFELSPTLIIISLLFFSIQQRFLSEWLHEGLHFNIHHKKNMNELITKWMICPIFFTPLNKMRKIHFKHHNKEKFFNRLDPDTHYAIAHNRKSLVIGILKDLLGYSAISNYLKYFFIKPKKDVNEKQNEIFSINIYVPCILVQFIFLFLSSYYNILQFYFLYYISMITIYPLLSRIRLYGQHIEIKNPICANLNNSSVSRNIKGTLLDRLLISSRLMQYHGERHLKPNLPFRAIEKIAQSHTSNDLNKEASYHFIILKALWNIK